MKLKFTHSFLALIFVSATGLTQTIGYGYEVITPKYKANLQPLSYPQYNTVYSQQITCEEAYRIIVTQGEVFNSVTPLYSEWLKKVTAYKLYGEIYVKAIVKRDEYGTVTDAYIYCGIPKYNWDMFRLYDPNPSYGEKFQKYIYDYTCNCR